MRLLITGGAGFIGSNFVRYILGRYPKDEIINLDKLTYAGSLDNIQDILENPRHTFVQGDIIDKKLVGKLISKADAIINFAAETHVDRSIEAAEPFLISNIFGVQVLLEAARAHKTPRFIQISTDEVYGDTLKGQFTEQSPLKPSSPYAASKAAADMLVLAYRRTYDLPVMISRCSNNYGPHQYPEKLVPFFIDNLLKGNQVPLYGKGSNIRDWLHVFDHCRAIDLMLHKGKPGEIYNVSANEEHSNLEVTRRMLSLLNLPEDRITFVADRPGHDIRYAIDATKIRQLGWKPEVEFEKGFKETVLWYKRQETENRKQKTVIKRKKTTVSCVQFPVS